MHEGDEDSQLISIKEAALVLNLSEITVKRYVSQGLVESVKIAGNRRVLKDSLINLTEEKTKAPIKKGQHFYWSQKDANYAKNLYEKYCQPGAMIMDPFLGAGSSLYATRSSRYKFVGIEINEHPIKIAEFNAKGLTTPEYEKLLERLQGFRAQHQNEYSYTLNNGEIVEFAKAIVNTSPVKATTVICVDKMGALIDSADHPELIEQYDQKNKLCLKKLASLPNPKLVKNSRIAIKDGMNLADIFSPVNYYLLSMLAKTGKDDAFKFLLGSVLHLCKLTDQKSQSQFPFWIPRTGALDRNIFTTLDKKARQLKAVVGITHIPEYKNFADLKKSKTGCFLINKPIQRISDKDIPDESVDFVLTDPPYYDQVAYSEYLKIWEYFLGYKSNFKDEIIVSQRTVEKSDEALYEKELLKAFSIINKKMKAWAIMAVYFKESRLNKIEAFLRILQQAGFTLTNQEYLSSTKFTYKQNTSADTAVGGDSLYVFKKSKARVESLESDQVDDAFIPHVIKAYAYQKKSFSLNDVVHEALIQNLYDKNLLSSIKDSKYVVGVLNELCVYDPATRLYKLKSSGVRNQIFYSDALELLKSLPDNSMDSCITDPPYNISGYDHKKNIGWLNSNKYWTDDKNFQKINESWDKFSDDDYYDFSKDWLTEIKRVVKPNGNIAIFGSYHNIYKLGFLLENLDLKVINSLIWYKRNAFPNITQRMFTESTEQIVWAVNNDKKHAKNWTYNYKILKELNGGKQMRNMFDIPMTKSSEKAFGKHPSQKPLRLLDILVQGLTNSGDVVIDPFAGSGTTAVAAKTNARDYLLIDNTYEFIQLSQKRLSAVPQKLSL